MATNTFKVGEMLNKRSHFSKTWMNFDGSYTTEIFQSPVHFEDVDGNLHNISTVLYDEADLFDYSGPVEANGQEILEEVKERSLSDIEANKLNRDNYDFQGLKVPFLARIPRNFRRGYTIGHGEETLHFTPIGASPAVAYLDNPNSNSVHYQDAWNDADVCLELTDTGIKETIIIKTDRAPSAFTFEVSGALEDDLTTGTLKLQPAWLQDANGEQRDVTQTIRREGEDTFIDLAADVSGLVYPIEIDPTVTIDYIGIAKDSWVSSNSKDQNLGSDPYLQLGMSGAINTRVLMQLDLSPIPTNASITQATVNLQQYTGNGTGYFLAYMNPIDIPWSENTVTWNNQPKYDSSIETSFTVTSNTASQRVSFDIKTMVEKWLSREKANNGFIMRSVENGVTLSVSYGSKENNNVSFRPSYTVTYNAPPTAPTVTAPNGGETWNSVHTIQWTAATDQINDNNKLTIAGTGNVTTATSLQAAGQIFKVTSTDLIYKIGIDFVASDVLYLKAGTTLILRDYNKTDNTRGTIRGQATVPSDVKTMGYVYATLSTPVSFPVGTILAVEAYNPTGIGSSVRKSDNANYTDGYSYSVTGTGTFVSETYDMHIEVYYGSYSDLKYQIQLSSNNGSTWKDIVSLTPINVTSYTYDFINEQESSLSKIRIRAFDGSVYGPWDESDGVFTIVHNVAPTMPTNLLPNGTVVDRQSVAKLSWQHNDPNTNDPQSKFDLQWRKQGDSTWNTVTQTTTNNYYDVPVNTFGVSTIEWQVRTYDQAGLSSPYSAIVAFNAADKPDPATLVYPTEATVIPVSNPVVQWSHPSQTDYWVRVLDETGANVVFEEKKTSVNKATTVTYNLNNNTKYKIQVAVKDQYGLWSDFTISNVTVSYTPPAIPLLSTIEDNKRGSIAVSIMNPTPVGTEPKVIYNDVYRKENNGSYIRIGEKVNVNSIFVDYTPLPKATITYYVIAYGDNGTFVRSNEISTTVSVSHTQISSIDNPNMFVSLVKRTDGTETNSIESEKMQFAGRAYPMTEFGTQMERAFEYSYKVFSLEEMLMMRELASVGETLLLRDNRGHKDYVTISSITVVEKPILWEINIKPEKVYYVEGV